MSELYSARFEKLNKKMIKILRKNHMTSSFTIKFEDTPKFFEDLYDLFREYGVVIIEDVIDNPDLRFENILKDFTEAFGSDWKTANLPPQTRPGMFQVLATHIPEMWNIRTNDNIAKIFKELYSRIRGHQVTDFVCSMDGLNLKPSSIGPICTEKSNDWMHLDQVSDENPLKCIQGQVPLTDTDACFVCTPKSHLAFPEIRSKIYDCKDGKLNWYKFPQESYSEIQAITSKYYSGFQIPIIAKKGSFIIWASSVLHSARLSTVRDDSYRCVVYVCYRPRDEFNKAALKKHLEYFNTGRSTTHWSDKVFPKNPTSKYMGDSKYSDHIFKMIKDPTKTGFLDKINSNLRSRIEIIL